jgi:hypothetical protein
MGRKCVFKFFSVLGAAVGSHLAAHMAMANWEALAIVLYGACVGMIVAWVVSLGMKSDCGDSKSCKK